MEVMPPITTNLHDVQERLNLAATAANRQPIDITLLAVSKTFPASAVREAYAAGQRHFGENYVQESVQKIEDLIDIRSELIWHFIGPLQSNKTQTVANHFDWVHSIDREKIAQRLNDQRPAKLPPLNVCVQVNISSETSKSGVNPADALALCQAITRMPHLTLRGLMSIPEPVEDPVLQRQAHRQLKEVFEQIKQALNDSTHFDTLSMGMSSDMEAAIAEGSTIVRIGTAIFGKRNYS
jgi:pyridoxal phosphate enzyme (YggS family)